MVLCNSVNCVEDFITFEPIEMNDNCISITIDGEDKCTTCETIEFTLKANPRENEKTVRKLFGITKDTDADIIWEQILKKCPGIVRPEPETIKEANAYYIAEPDYVNVRQMTKLILTKIGDEESNSYKFIKALSQILLNLPDMLDYLRLNPTVNKQQYIMQNMRRILFDMRCSSQSLHYPQQLTLNIELFFNLLLNADKEKFDEVIVYLNSKPQLCLEGTIEMCKVILGVGELEKGGKRRKYKRKYKKTHKKRIKNTKKIHKRKYPKSKKI